MRNLRYEISHNNHPIAIVNTCAEAAAAKQQGFTVKEILTPYIDAEAQERNRKAREKREKILAEKRKRG